MTELMEYGPNRPATEAAKIGNTLYEALVKIYGEYELSSSCTVNGSPQIVRIGFKVSKNDSKHAGALDSFQEDAQTILENYGFDHN